MPDLRQGKTISFRYVHTPKLGYHGPRFAGGWNPGLAQRRPPPIRHRRPCLSVPSPHRLRSTLREKLPRILQF